MTMNINGRDYIEGEIYDRKVHEVRTLKREVERLSKPVMWVRMSIDGKHYSLCEPGGDRITRLGSTGPYPAVTLQCVRRTLSRSGITVKIYPDDLPEKKPEPKAERPYSDVEAILVDAYNRAKDGTISGYEASMLKWDTLIEWSEETGKVPPDSRSVAGGYGFYDSCCGLCLEFKNGPCFSCCPLQSCQGNLNNLHTDDPAEWLIAAKEFRQFIVDKAGPKQEPEWVYGVWDTDYGNYQIAARGKMCECNKIEGLHAIIQALPDIDKDPIGFACYRTERREYELQGRISDTPIFGVHKLTGEDEGYHGAFYHGKFIEGTCFPDPDECVTATLDLMKAKTLADLPTAD